MKGPMPLAVLFDGSVLHNPDETLLASKLSLLCGFDEADTYHAVIVGAGPAGLAAAVYAASEGSTALIFDSGGLAERPAQAPGSKNISGFQPAFPVTFSLAAHLSRQLKSERK